MLYTPNIRNLTANHIQPRKYFKTAQNPKKKAFSATLPKSDENKAASEPKSERAGAVRRVMNSVDSMRQGKQ